MKMEKYYSRLETNALIDRYSLRLEIEALNEAINTKLLQQHNVMLIDEMIKEKEKEVKRLSRIINKIEQINN